MGDPDNLFRLILTHEPQLRIIINQAIKTTPPEVQLLQELMKTLEMVATALEKQKRSNDLRQQINQLAAEQANKVTVITNELEANNLTALEQIQSLTSSPQVSNERLEEMLATTRQLLQLVTNKLAQTS